ncbi:MAG: transcription antitermination factor NusB [Oscillospiraceae bacterium]|jgi:N utilization substance protein B|nr:transcription antitermination factor NusB [Oscillospiraceae bacterium]
MEMSRTAARELALRLTFALMENPVPSGEFLEEILSPDYYMSLGGEDKLYEAYPGDDARSYLARAVAGVSEHGAELDGYISKYAVGWDFHRISRTAAAILRLAMFETLYMSGEVPVRAAINEAVELAKKYEHPETVPFVNGLLASFVRGELPGE